MKTGTGEKNKDELFEDIVNTYQLSLMKMCVIYLRDAELARDAVQETFFRAYKNIDKFRGDSSMKTWLTSIAINTCKNMIRSWWSRHVDGRVTLDMISGMAAPMDEDSRMIVEEIMNLPPRQREAALLCWQQGMTNEEAASVLGISRQTLSGRLKQAKENMQKALKGSDTDEPE